MSKQKTVISRPVSGSKPRKFIKYVRYSNPSLVSMEFKQTLNDFPSKQLNPEKRHHANRNVENRMKQTENNLKHVRSVSEMNAYKDSLTKAEDEFVNKKIQTPQQQKKGSEMGKYSKYNFKMVNEIKHRQYHGYNIINCYPQ